MFKGLKLQLFVWLLKSADTRDSFQKILIIFSLQKTHILACLCWTPVITAYFNECIYINYAARTILKTALLMKISQHLTCQNQAINSTLVSNINNK